MTSMMLAAIKQIVLAFDQLLNTLLFFLPGGTWADETLSARSWRMRKSKPFHILRPVIDGLFYWDKDHCQTSFESEKLRNQSPLEER